MANLYAFMATSKPGDTILVPPASIGEHVTDHNAGAARLYGLNIVEMQADAEHYTVNLDELRKQAHALDPTHSLSMSLIERLPTGRMGLYVRALLSKNAPMNDGATSYSNHSRCAFSASPR